MTRPKRAHGKKVNVDLYCDWCGNAIRFTGGSSYAQRPRKFCNDTCRSARWRTDNRAYMAELTRTRQLATQHLINLHRDQFDRLLRQLRQREGVAE